MFRATIRADEKSDIEATLADLRDRCERSDFIDVESAVDQMRALLLDWTVRGQQLANAGSQMHTTHVVAGEGYSIKLIFRANDQRPAWKRLTDAVRGA